jgi:hypothetical protein
MIETSLVIVYSLVSNLRKLKLPLSFILFTLFLIYSLRSNYGNDYESYNLIFKNTKINHQFEIKNYINFEGFFNILIYISPTYRFLIIIHSFLYFSILYYIIKFYIKNNKVYFFMFFMINPYIFLIHMSALRQSLAILIFLIGCYYSFSKNNKIPLVLAIILSTMFHTSAIVLIILIPLFSILNSETTYKKILLIFILALLLPHINNLEIISDLLERLGFDFLIRYKIYIEDSQTNSTSSVITKFIIFLGLSYLCILFKQEKCYVRNFALIASAIELAAYAMPMISRLAMYFEMFIPIMLANAMNKYRNGNIVCIILLIIYGLRYVNFFTDSIYAEPYSSFHLLD